MLPATACWRHEGLRVGFEVAFFSPSPMGTSIEGTTVGLQDGIAFLVSYRMDIDHAWRTRAAQITIRTAARSTARTIEGDGSGRWSVDGQSADHLDGCLDIDLESSAMTNTLPVHRRELALGQRAEAPAAYVRLDGNVERLEQSYLRVQDDDHHQSRYEYHAPAYEFRSLLVYDDARLVVNYPGIAARVG